jgi:hypothetical protein
MKDFMIVPSLTSPLPILKFENCQRVRLNGKNRLIFEAYERGTQLNWIYKCNVAVRLNVTRQNVYDAYIAQFHRIETRRTK